jgi:hypothetical protein
MTDRAEIPAVNPAAVDAVLAQQQQPASLSSGSHALLCVCALNRDLSGARVCFEESESAREVNVSIVIAVLWRARVANGFL